MSDIESYFTRMSDEKLSKLYTHRETLRKSFIQIESNLENNKEKIKKAKQEYFCELPISYEFTHEESYGNRYSFSIQLTKNTRADCTVYPNAHDKGKTYNTQISLYNISYTKRPKWITKHKNNVEWRFKNFEIAKESLLIELRTIIKDHINNTIEIKD